MGFGIMGIFTEEIATEFNFPNITIYRMLKDGVLASWRARSNPNFVMYNPLEHNTEIDLDTLEEKTVVYYYTIKGFNKDYNFSNFPWVSIMRSVVNENYIF